MTMVGHGGITEKADDNQGDEKDDEDKAEIQVQDDAATHGDGYTETASAQGGGDTTDAQPLKQQPTATATVQTVNPDAATPVPQGQTAAVPPGTTITLGAGAIMHVNSGSVTVVGGGTRVEAVAVIINVGCTVDALSTCCAEGAVIAANTRVSATSGPIALTRHRHGKAEVELVSGSATIGTGTHVGEAIVHAGRSATVIVGATGASITNTEGAVAMAAAQHPELV